MSTESYQALIDQIDDLRLAVAYESSVLTQWTGFLTYPAKPRAESAELVADLALASRGEGPLAAPKPFPVGDAVDNPTPETLAHREVKSLRRALYLVEYVVSKHRSYKTFPKSCLREADLMLTRTRLAQTGDLDTAYWDVTGSAMRRALRDTGGVVFNGRIKAWEAACRA